MREALGRAPRSLVVGMAALAILAVATAPLALLAGHHRGGRRARRRGGLGHGGDDAGAEVMRTEAQHHAYRLAVPNEAEA